MKCSKRHFQTPVKPDFEASQLDIASILQIFHFLLFPQEMCMKALTIHMGRSKL